MPDFGLYDVSAYDGALYADEAHVSYELDCDFDRDGVYDESLTGRMIQTLTWKFGMDSAWQEVAQPGELTVILQNNDNELSPDNPGADYLTKLVPGCLMRLRALLGGVSYTQYIGRLHHLSIQPSMVSVEDAHRVTLHITDPISELIDGEYTPPLLTNVRVDEVLTRLFDDGLVAWPYDSSFWLWDYSSWDVDTVYFLNSLTDFEVAYTTLAFSGDAAETGQQRGVQPYGFMADIVAAEAGGRLWWHARTGKFKFHNRYHDADNSVVAAVPSEITSVDPDDIHFGDDIANAVVINWVGRSVGTPASILGSADNVPFRLTGGQVLQTTLRYRDPSNPSARVGGKDVITPVMGTDIIANAASDGTGADKTSHVGTTITIGATSTAITLTNTGKTDIYITKEQIRGTPLTTWQSQAATAQDALSTARYNRRPMAPKQVSAINTAEFAQGYATKLLGQFAEPVTRLGAVTITAVEDADMIEALTLTVGDRITLVDTFTGHNRDYVIVGEQHFANAASEAHVVRWVLKPYRAEGLWIYDVSKYDIDTIYAL